MSETRAGLSGVGVGEPNMLKDGGCPGPLKCRDFETDYDHLCRRRAAAWRFYKACRELLNTWDVVIRKRLRVECAPPCPCSPQMRSWRS